MALKVKFFVRVSKVKKANDNKTNKDVNIRVRFTNGRKFDLFAITQSQINPEFWNNKGGIVRQRAEFKDGEELQNKLNELKGFIIREHDKATDKSQIDASWLNLTVDKFYNPSKYLQDNLTLFSFIQHFIDNSEKRINPNTGNPVCYKMRREYEVTFEYLKEYAKKYGEPDFIDIDLEFYQQFIELLRLNKLSINTQGKKIQTLKIFLNAATEQGVNHYQKYKSRKFKSLSEESENIYLTKEELKKFYEYDFSNKPSLERVRDLFIIGSWTGLRFSDIEQITLEKIHGDYIHIKQKKTGHKVVIPVHFTVREILNKYNGQLPKPISNQKFNEYLKDAARISEINSKFAKKVLNNGLTIEKQFPKHKLISSHTARRSFCTNAYKDNIPTLAIMAISGHRTEKAFLKYIKADGKEHAKKVLQIWQNNGDFIRATKN